MSLGAPELIIVLVIILLLFGARKLPKLAGSLGESIKEFRRATEDEVGDQSAGEADDGARTPASDDAGS